MEEQRCLFCGGDESDPQHRDRCDGRQGGRPEPGDPFAAYTAPYAVGRETSAAAAHAIEPSAVTLCGQVLAAIRACHGLTCFEIEEALHLRHQTASARIWDLHTRGLITDSGARRLTSASRAAVVWVAMDQEAS